MVQPKSKCSACDKPYTNTSMVQCDACNKWLHFDCVGVDDNIIDQPWKCVPCGGDPYKLIEKNVEPKGNSGEPTVDELLSALEEQQETERQLRSNLEEEKNRVEEERRRREKVENEYDAIKRLLPSENLQHATRKHTRIQEETDDDQRSQRSQRFERFQRAKEQMRQGGSDGGKSADCSGSQKSVKDSRSPVTPTATPAVDGGFSELATLMRQAHVEDLPKFAGNIKDWPLFLAVFKRTTKVAAIDGVTNIGRLTKALEGEARSLVLDQLTFGLEPEGIIETLKQQYGKESDVLKVLSNELMSLPVLVGLKDSRLQTFAMDLKTYVAQLKSLGMEKQLCNDYLESLLHEKLVNVPSMYAKWDKAKDEEKSKNIADFADFVMDQWKRLPRAIPGDTKRAPRAPAPDSRVKVTGRPVNVHADDDLGIKRVCPLCDGPHDLRYCREFKRMGVEDRWELVRDKGLCFSCLISDKHAARNCPEQKACLESGCDKFHHRLLHQRRSRWGGNSAEGRPVAEQRQAMSHTQEMRSDVNFVNLSLDAHQQTQRGDSYAITAKVVAVRVYGRDGAFVNDYAFLDDGSAMTLMDRGLSSQLGLSGAPETLRLRWTKGITRDEKAIRCDVDVSAIKGGPRFTLREVYSVPNLDLSMMSQNGEELAQRYRHLHGLKLPSFDDVKPRILIGLEHASFLSGPRTFVGAADEPMATKTKLGWVVFGRQSRLVVSEHQSDVKMTVQNTHTRLARADSKSNDHLHALVKHFFAVESLGVEPGRLRSLEDVRAEDVMKSTLRFVDGRYEIGLLWKTDHEFLPLNNKMALRRLKSEEKKLAKDPGSLKWMNDHVAQLVTKGYARKATEEDLRSDWERVWICPMFTVINNNKVPPKRRCVADVAAKEANVSLNCRLLKGPDNLIALPAALCRARENAIMVTADVAEMFHQIRIIEADQQCQRFLWRDGDQSRDPTVYIMQAMMFGPTCSPSKAQFVKNHHAEKYRMERPEAADVLQRYMYVDDYYNSHESENDAVRVTRDAIEICRDMGFDLVQVQSNCAGFLKRMPARNVKPEIAHLGIDDASTYTAKLLGMFWKPSEDVFIFKRTFGELASKMAEEGYRPTKREVLSTLMKFFDPLGLAAKFIIRGKWILQDIWRESIAWDENVSDALASEWLKFLSDFKEVEKLQIPRWYGSRESPNRRVDLIVFVDASDKAFAAAGYFRFEDSGRVQVALVMAKAKVAPVKMLSIPRLELEAAKLGARLAKSIGELHSFPIAQRFLLSDSTCTLSWINSKKFDFPPFVAHRVGEILELTSPSEWYYVPSKENVADEATKITKAEPEDSAPRWFHGAPFLGRPPKVWPIERPKMVGDALASSKNYVMTHEAESSAAADHPINRISARFRSDWNKLTKVTSRVIRVAKRREFKQSASMELSAAEIFEAENEIFRVVQQECFSEAWENFGRRFDAGELGTLFGHATRPAQLAPFTLLMNSSDRLIRVKSRDKSSESSYSAKNPILLPPGHELVRLFLYHLHRKNSHMGIETTIADARDRVWIISIRPALLKVIAKCQVCRNRRANPKLPTIGSLHASRTAFDQKPFSFVGIDCFGPIIVREKRSEVKRWGVLFTCLTYRAIHLEVVADLSTDQMLMALRRLLARRGPAKALFSDNGTNFIGAARVVREELEMKQRELGNMATAGLNIEWRFIPAYSPWMGGAWERLIGYVKRCLKFCLAGETPTESVLNNVLIEAELLTNKRPLTHTPIDPDDAEPLSPNVALFGSSDSPQALSPSSDANPFAKFHRRRVTHLVEKFKKRWEREYLPTIARSEQVGGKQRHIKEGDVVLLAEGEADRDRWKLGRIIRVHPSDDNEPRIADVKMGNGTVKLNRAIGNLAVLDVGESSEA